MGIGIRVRGRHERGSIIAPMANKPTYDDANLLLRLYELRREETMRKARAWFATFSADDPEQLQKVSTPGSQESAYLRMVTSYWEMAASLVTSGVLNEELFLENSGELLFAWEKSRPLIERMRQTMKNPKLMKNVEKMAHALIERMGPESYEEMSKVLRGRAAGNQA
jgi:L-rhamnose mutarotase